MSSTFRGGLLLNQKLYRIYFLAFENRPELDSTGFFNFDFIRRIPVKWTSGNRKLSVVLFLFHLYFILGRRISRGPNNGSKIWTPNNVPKMEPILATSKIFPVAFLEIINPDPEQNEG